MKRLFTDQEVKIDQISVSGISYKAVCADRTVMIKQVVPDTNMSYGLIQLVFKKTVYLEESDSGLFHTLGKRASERTRGFATVIRRGALSNDRANPRVFEKEY